MKTASFCRQNFVALSLILAAGSLQYCGPAVPSNPNSIVKNEEPKSPETPTTDQPTPPSAPTPGREKYDADQAEQRAWAARIRLEMFEQARHEPNWTKKFTPLAQYFAHYDFQRWEPFESYRKNRRELDALIDFAIDDFLSIWKNERLAVAQLVLNAVNVYDNSVGTNALLALALTCDQISSKQERNAYKYRFRAQSVQDILFFALQSLARNENPTTEYERKIFENKEIGYEILQWRYNGILRWSYAQLVFAEPSASPSAGKTLTFNGRRIGDLEAIVANLQRARIARQQLIEISQTPRVSRGIETRFTRLNLEKAKLEIPMMPNSKKRDLAREILDLLDNLTRTF